MAFPAVPQFWTSRRKVYEDAIVRKRNQANDYRARWSENAQYFTNNDTNMMQHRAWESENCLANSIAAYRKGKDEKAKIANLEQRRTKLSKMLKAERDEYEAELKGYSKSNYARLHEMKDKTDTLRSAREEERKILAREKLYEHWRENNPDIRKIEQEQLKEHVIGSWPSQMVDRKQRLDSARKESEEIERQMEEERQAAIVRDREIMEEKIEEEKKLKTELMEQMLELRARDVEAEMLKKEEAELGKQQWQLEELEEQRQQMERVRKQKDFGRVLLRQHIAQMRRHSKQVQEELELDRKILVALAEKEDDLKQVQTARRENARADASWMKKVIDEQIRVEKAREAELDLIYQDEAARMWQKREAEWEKERRARERLMREVLESRTEQIELRMEEVKERKKESLQHREQLLRELEIANQLTRREQEKLAAEKEELKLDLQQQTTARQENEKDAQLLQLQELEQERRDDAKYESFLRGETERMKIRGFEPRQFGHRRQAWH